MSSSSELSGFIRAFYLCRDKVPAFERYPFSIPAIRSLNELRLNPRVTFFVGENGSGKSTLVEAIAVAAGFNAEGGTRNFSFATRSSESELHRHIRLVRGTRSWRNGYFLRAESLFTLATNIEAMDAEPGPAPRVIDGFGGVSLHEQSHGEAFLAVVRHKFRPNGLYILDEPESALSPQRQLALLAAIHSLATSGGAQFVIASHSAILLACPDATIYQLSSGGISECGYEDTESFRITRGFVLERERYLRALLFTE